LVVSNLRKEQKMKNLAQKAIIIMSIAMLLSACAPGAMPSPTSTPPSAPADTPKPPPAGPTDTAKPQPPALAYALAVPAAKGFADYTPYQVSGRPGLKPYSTDPSQAKNVALLGRLTPDQVAALKANGFVVVPDQAPQFYEIYKRASERGEPVFVTTDVLLHTYHILYDYTLRLIEIERFVDDLSKLNQAMIAATSEQYAKTSGEAKEAAKRNLAFFAVANALLVPEAKAPAEVADLVKAELANIAAHKGFQESPIFGYKEDYSQYVPRGHYTRNETFERYFKAMMWYGRMMFRLRPGDTPQALAAGRRETRQAILINVALQNSKVGTEPALNAWERIYEPTVFFVGKSDDLTVYDYAQVAHEIYGSSLQLNDLNDQKRLDPFIDRAMSLRPPKIVSSYVTDQEAPEKVTKGFRFMGQRFIPDSYMFQELVYNKVGTQGRPRLFPKGLDVASVLGSERAYEILDRVYNETQYANYEKQMKKLRQEFGSLPAGQWIENLYWNWLHTLRPLLGPKGSGYPPFMTNAAWTDKELNTFLGSWTELRHDTILYAKQSYTLKVTGIGPEPEPATGYVEPNPELYARLAALITQMRKGLESRGLLNDEYRMKMQQMEKLVLDMKTISEKELAGQAISPEEAGVLHNVGGILEGITTFSTKTADKITSEADTRVALVADVHSDVNSGQVLEEGVGDVFMIYVVTPSGNDTVISQGGVFSYYEFTHPMSDRLTDEKWQSLSPRPPLPVWSKSFVTAGR